MQELTIMNSKGEEEKVFIGNDKAFPPIFSMEDTGQYYIQVYVHTDESFFTSVSVPIFTRWWLGDLEPNKPGTVPYTGGREL